MKILYAEDNDSIRDLFRVHLESLLVDAQISECLNGQIAIEILQNKGFDFDLVISDYEMPGGNGDILYRELRGKSDRIPFVLFSSYTPADLPQQFPDFSEKNFDFFIQKPIDYKNFQLFLKKVIIKSKKAFEIDELFKKVKLDLFYKYDQMDTDIFVRLGEDNYVKIIKANDNYSREQLQKYRQKGIQFLYVKNDDYFSFTEKLPEKKQAIENDSIPPAKFDGVVVSTIENIISEVSRLGLTARSLNLIKRCYEKVEDDVSNSKLKAIISKGSTEPDFVLEHSYLLSYVLLAMIKYIPGLSKHYAKELFIAAILHDSSLKGIDFNYAYELVDYNKVHELEGQQSFLLHPFYTVTKLSSTGQKLSRTVTEAILNHHENPLGTGFPSKIQPKNLKQHAAIIVMAHFVVNELYRVKFDMKMIKQIRVVIPNIFTEGCFRDLAPYLMSFIEDIDKLNLTKH